MACYKSALIDLDRRWANKGQDMENKLKEYLERFGKNYPVLSLPNQPDRLRRVDTNNSEAIVGSANIDEIAEPNRND